MRQNFFTEQELMVMPLGKLRRLDINSPDEEAKVQEIVNRRVGVDFEANRVTLRKDLDIQTPEQEAKWDKELAQRIAEMKPQQLAEIEEQPMMEQASDEPVAEPKEDEKEPELEAKIEVKKSYYKSRPKKVKVDANKA